MRFHGVFLGNQHKIWSKQHNGKVSKLLDPRRLLGNHLIPCLKLALEGFRPLLVYSILKFFQVDNAGMLRMTSSARYFKEGVGSRRPN